MFQVLRKHGGALHLVTACSATEAIGFASGSAVAESSHNGIFLGTIIVLLASLLQPGDVLARCSFRLWTACG